MDAMNAEQFRQLQLSLSRFLTSPGLGKVIQQAQQSKGTTTAVPSLVDSFAAAGTAVDPGTHVKIEPVGADDKVTFTVCVDFGEAAHCAVVTIQSPITFG